MALLLVSPCLVVVPPCRLLLPLPALHRISRPRSMSLRVVCMTHVTVERRHVHNGERHRRGKRKRKRKRRTRNNVAYERAIEWLLCIAIVCSITASMRCTSHSGVVVACFCFDRCLGVCVCVCVCVCACLQLSALRHFRGCHLLLLC